MFDVTFVYFQCPWSASLFNFIGYRECVFVSGTTADLLTFSTRLLTLVREILFCMQIADMLKYVQNSWYNRESDVAK